VTCESCGSGSGFGIKGLIGAVAEEARHAASFVDGFKYGAIQIALVAFSDDGMNFIGASEMGCEVAYTYRIGESRHRPAGTYLDKRPANCGAYASNMVGGAYCAISHGCGNKSSDCPESATNILGVSRDAGCVAYDVLRRVRRKSIIGSFSRLVRIFVTIMGADGKTNEQIALRASETISIWFNEHPYPSMPDDGAGSYEFVVERARDEISE